MIIFGYLQLNDFEKRGDTNGEKQVKAWNLNFEIKDVYRHPILLRRLRLFIVGKYRHVPTSRLIQTQWISWDCIVNGFWLLALALLGSHLLLALLPLFYHLVKMWCESDALGIRMLWYLNWWLCSAVKINVEWPNQHFKKLCYIYLLRKLIWNLYCLIHIAHLLRKLVLLLISFENLLCKFASYH